jgi:hypothetical protein
LLRERCSLHCILRMTTDPISRQQTELAARFADAVPRRVNADAHLVWRGRTLNARCLVQIGAKPFLLEIEAGRVGNCRSELPLPGSWDFAVRGSVQAWAGLWQDPPPAGWHDIFALSKRGEMSFEGNLQPFMAHLQYIKDVLALPRRAGA